MDDENNEISNSQALNTYSDLNLGVLRKNSSISCDLEIVAELLNEFGFSINFNAPVS